MACIVPLDGSAPEARTYEFGAEDVASIDDSTLEQYRIADQWFVIAEEAEYYESTYDGIVADGNRIQRCMVATPWTYPDNEDEFGYYTIESGARYAGSSDTYDLNPSQWESEYRPPNEPLDQEI